MYALHVSVCAGLEFFSLFRSAEQIAKQHHPPFSEEDSAKCRVECMAHKTDTKMGNFCTFPFIGCRVLHDLVNDRHIASLCWGNGALLPLQSAPQPVLVLVRPCDEADVWNMATSSGLDCAGVKERVASRAEL